MSTSVSWRKSSYSSFGDGDSCVEIAHCPNHIAIRDSKDPTVGTVTVPADAFTPFIEALKTPPTP